MQDIRGRVVRERVINGRLTPVTPVIGHSDWGEIGGTLKDQTDLQDALDKKADKARVDILEKLTLGQVWDYDDHDETVYQQTVPAGGHGVEMESVGGRSVVWNQLVESINGTTSRNGITFTKNGNGSYTIAGIQTSSGTFANVNYASNTPSLKVIQGHKYYFPKFSDGILYLRFYPADIVGDQLVLDNTIVTATRSYADGEANYVRWQFYADYTEAVNLTLFPRIHDLTAIFGSGNEPTSTSDPRIAWIEAYAEEHPEYNAGEVVHGEVTGITESGTADTPIDYPIPAEVQALEGYGWGINASLNNHIDFNGKTYVQNVTKLTSEDAVSVHMYSSYGYLIYSSLASVAQRDNGNGICSYGTMYSHAYADDDFFVRDNSIVFGAKFMSKLGISTSEQWAEYVSQHPIEFILKLATPIETDISQYITDEWQTIETEPNGSITFQNDNLLPVPIKDRFKVKLTEALS